MSVKGIIQTSCKGNGMARIQIASGDKAIQNYYKLLDDLQEKQLVMHEGGTRRAFATLLSDLAKKKNWTLVEEVSIETHEARRIRVDGALRDQMRLSRAYWEAKDSHDDLDVEIRKKIADGYPLNNIIFEDTETAVLYQNGNELRRAPIRGSGALAQLLTDFFNYDQSVFNEFEEAIESYRDGIPDIAERLKARIADAREDNPNFIRQFDNFMALCQTSINPNISRDAVDEMLIQHLMTERIIRRVFNVEWFTRRNVIAREIENVIDALTSQHFDRKDFLGGLDGFYKAVEDVADRQADFRAKQDFINMVYERFFQGYSVKVADTHGIVYTPQPIVDFMCAAVEDTLHSEFGKKLGDEDVILIDPATGTGNFVVNLLRRAFERNPLALDDFYQHRLFANEVMLMPYYIASLNIEHQYWQLTGKTDLFPGLCFVDTLDLTAARQLPSAMITEANSQRVKDQQRAKINVIIGNPPYNVGQLNENDNNKNRKYAVIDKRVRETYAKDSNATLKNQLYDAYVKFFRWAVDRLDGRDGIVCYVSNNSFVDAYAFDGFRKNLLGDFQRVYHLDLGGNLRKNRPGTSISNVFDIRVGVGVTVALRSSQYSDSRLFYRRVDETGDKKDKLDYLSEMRLHTVPWRRLKPNRKHTWLVSNTEGEYAQYLSIGSKEAKRAKPDKAETIFKTYSNGVKTNRDMYVFDFRAKNLKERMKQFMQDYNVQVALYQQQSRKPNVDDFVDYENISWSSTLKQNVKRGKYASYQPKKMRKGLYRPFTKKLLFYDEVLVDRPGQFRNFFPNDQSQVDNRIIVCSDVAYRANSFSALISDSLLALHLCSSRDAHQCFPFYTYDEDGSNRRENITDWALEQFRQHYADPSLSKWDIFFYVYALLHHPGYRERYALDLKRELPRIPFAPDFRRFSHAGAKLSDLHLNYETAEKYKLRWAALKQPVNYKVLKMRPGKKRDAQDGEWQVFDSLRYNDTLLARDIPAGAFAYRLGNRSALEWVIDQYRVKTDKRSGITHDPNGYSEDEKYIVELIQRVITVSLRTVEIVEELNALPFRDPFP